MMPPASDAFCNGMEMDMSMQGFQNLGAHSEYIRSYRVQLGKQKKSKNPKLLWCGRLFLYGVNLAFGYFLMLIAMTYSSGLFSMVILGLVVGHGLFNMKLPVRESTDPCCTDEDDPEVGINSTPLMG